MKKLLLFAMLFITIAASGQIRLGYTKSEIAFEFSSDKPESSISNDGTPMLSIETPYSYVFYYFKNNICMRTAIFPKTEKYVQYYVERYNKDYVIVSNAEWKYYTNGYVIKIILTYFSEENQFAFVADYL